MTVDPSDILTRKSGPRPTGIMGAIAGLGDLVVKLGVVGGVAFTALEYRAAQERGRIDRVTGYIDRFEAGELAIAVRTITQELRELVVREDYQQLRQIAEDDTETADAARVQIARLLAYDVRGGTGLGNEVDQVVSFYNSLQVCVEEKLCDARVAHAFFDGHATSLYANFEPLFLERIESWPGYSDGLLRFVKSAEQVTGAAPAVE